MQDLKTINDEAILTVLFGEEKKDIVILFDNTPDKNRFSSIIESQIKNHPHYTMDRSKPFRVSSQGIQYHDRKIIFGIHRDEELLQNQIVDKEMFTYAKG